MADHVRRRFGVGALVAVLATGLALGVFGSYAVARRGGHDGDDHTANEGSARPERSAEGAQSKGEQAARARYVCPMHPTVVSDHPGQCPICGMNLVLQQPAVRASGGEQAKGERKVAFYRSPMDPKQTSHEPKKDEMGMDYLPVHEDEVSGQGASGGKVAGLAAIDIDPQRQQLIGLRTAEVTRGAVGESWRTVGRVAVDETRVHHVALRVSGFVDQVFADYVGKSVKAGEPLFSLYSPDLVSAAQEYLLARRMGERLGGKEGGDLAASARRRLELWDIPRGEIRRLERTGKVDRTLTFTSPMNGVVTKKDLVMGHRLAEGDMPLEITDLSKVWVLADAYETDLGRLKLGMAARLNLQAFPNRVFSGKVIFIDPLLNAGTRTAKVRLEFPNPSGELRPEMFGEVTFQAAARQGLRIPPDAVVNSGTRNVVFVALGDGKFTPREVQLGAQGSEAVEVLSGLSEGEKVVTRANFLIDSESRLRSSLAAMSDGQ